MNEYDFTLKFRLRNPEESAEKYVDELAIHGCDDALIGIGKLGRVSLNFTREAKSAFEAVTSAIKDVKKVIPTAILVEASPDFVGITDIAEIYGASRQYIRKVIFSQAITFPDPIYEGKPSFWHLADVLSWLESHEPAKLNETLIEISRLNMQINLYRSLLKASSSTEPMLHFDTLGPNRDAEWNKFFRSAFGYASNAAPHGKRSKGLHSG